MNNQQATDLMLRVSDLNVYYGESHILRNVDLSVAAGQMVCLIGRNGVGKTTLLKTIMGLLSPRTGEMFLGDKSLTKLTPDRRAKLGIGYVPQGREIIPRVSVKDNLLLGLEAKAEGRKGNESIPEEIFELFPVLKTMLARMGGDLSGGQQQQLAIARAYWYWMNLPKVFSPRSFSKLRQRSNELLLLLVFLFC
jgi:urea transport system ATP-binding protein